MNLVRKIFTLEKAENITVDFIENFIKGAGFEPLRWAIVEIKENKFVVDAVVIF